MLVISQQTSCHGQYKIFRIAQGKILTDQLISFIQIFDGENIDGWHLDNVLTMELENIEKEKFDGSL